MIMMSDAPRPQTVSDAEKIQAPSIPVLKDEFGKQAMDLGRKLTGQQLGKGELLNSLVTWFLMQRMEMRIEIIGEGLAKFQAILRGEASLANDSETGARVPAPRETGSSKRPNKPKATG
jgi:hypothetical protein